MAEGARPGITRALVSAASRRTTLDTTVQPKPLLDIEGEPLISHVLRQLHRGGIAHVVLVLRCHSRAIIQEVEEVCKSHPALTVDVLELGSDWDGFYAKSLIAARDYCQLEEADSPGILIATADHIFDERLVAEMCRADLEPDRTEVSVLVDFARTPFVGLPETTVGVRSKDSRIQELSRALGRPAVVGAPGRPGIGVEAGLFACRRSLFDHLAALEKTHEYFSLSDAVQQLAAAGLVSSVATAGRRWVAVETLEELDSTRRSSNSDWQPLPRGPSDCASEQSQETPRYLREPVPVFFVAGSNSR